MSLSEPAYGAFVNFREDADELSDAFDTDSAQPVLILTRPDDERPAYLAIAGLRPAVTHSTEHALKLLAERNVRAILVSTLLNAAYFLPIVYSAFFRPHAGASQVRHAAPNTPRAEGQHGEAPPTMVGALMVTAAGTVLLFLFPDAPLALATRLVGGAP